MADDIKIGIAGDASKFIRETEDAEQALEKVSDALDDMARESKKGADKAEDAVDKLADSFDEARRAVKKLEDAGDQAGDGIKKGMKKAEGGLDEFKSEASQTAKESAASFDGSFESIGDVVQEVAANAFAGFGPAGAAAGIAVAAGAGVMIDAITKVGEAFDGARESAFTMAYDVGGALTEAGVQARMAEWTSDTEKWKQVTDLAVASGWDEIDVLKAMANGGDDLDRLSSAFAKNGAQSNLTQGRLWELEAAIAGTKDGYLSGSQAAEVNAAALYDYAQSVGTATGETDELGNAIYALPDGTEVVVNAETKRASENINAFQGKVNSVTGKTVGVNADTSAATAGLNNWISQNNGKTIKVYGKYISPAGSNVP